MPLFRSNFLSSIAARSCLAAPLVLANFCHAASPPLNDSFAGSAVISTASGSALTYNTFATTEIGEPSHGGQTFSRSLWWSWTAPASGWANFSTAGSGGPLLIAVYTGDTIAKLSSVGVTSPLPAFAEPLHPDSVSVPVLAGQTYHIAVAVPQWSASAVGPLADRVVFGVNQPPTIVSDALVRGVKDLAFSYVIRATNGATRYAALGLPPGLTLNPWTGAITGAPTATGIFDGEISATGPGGTTSASVRLEIAADTSLLQPPDFSSGDAAVIGYVGASLSKYYYVTPAMKSFTATSVPPGLIAALGSSGSYGTISGTPTQAGTFKVVLRAANAAGANEVVTTFKILANPPLPLITSSAAAHGTTGQAFSYSFSKAYVENDDRTPTYTTSDLPPGLVFNGTSISGTPTQEGTYTVPVEAKNSGGSTNATLTIAIMPPTDTPAPAGVPDFSSASGAVGVSGRIFSYSAFTSNPPATYSATGLPAGLSIDPATGRISGTSSQSGTFRATISATNASGTTTTPLTLTLKTPKPPLLTSPAAAAGTVGESFGYTLTALDSEFSYGLDSSFASTIQCQVDSLPDGLVFRPSDLGFYSQSGYITGKPTTAGTYRVPISATAHGVTTHAVLTLIIADQPDRPPIITSAAATHGNIGTSFSYSLTASSLPTARSVSSLPPGLSFDAGTGVISGTPTQSGTFLVEVAATNSIGTGTARLTFIIDPAPPLSPNTSGAAATEGIVGVSLSEYVYFSNPLSESVTFTATGLPPGLTIPASSDGSIVSISGTPTEAGTFPVTIDVQGNGGTTRIVRTLVIRPSVDPPTISSPLSADGYVGRSFSYYLSGSGGGTFTYTVGSLPPGLGFGGYEISGKPTASGTYEIPLTISNARGTSQATLVLRVATLPPAPVLGFSATARAYLNQPFSFTFSASEGTSYSLSGPLPTGVTFDSSQPSLKGTPRQTGSFPLRLTANGAGGSVTAPFTLSVEANLPAPVITSPVAVWWSSYNYYRPYQLTAMNFPTSYGAEGQPAGITFNASTGVLSGYIPSSVPRAYPVTVSATNSAGKTSATVTLLNFSSLGPNYGFGSAMAVGALNTPFSYRFVNYSSPYLRNFYTAGLPDGLTMDSSTGVISGSPRQAGTFAVKISASALSAPYPVVATLTLLVQETPQKPIVTSNGRLSGAVGAAFSATLNAANTLTFSAEGLPPGLSLAATTGKITGIPTTAGHYTVKADATNAGGTTSFDLIFDIAAAPAVPTFSSAAAARGYQGIAFNYGISATNQPTRYEADGLPVGLVINSLNGIISGTPTAPGKYAVTLRAINTGGTGTAKLSLDITAPDTPVISSASYVEGMVGKNVSYSISGSDSPTSFSASDLPPGLFLNPSTHSIEGIPSTPGTYLVTIGATNAGGTGAARVTFRVLSGKPSWLTSAAGSSTLVGDSFSLYLSDFESGYDFGLKTEDLPPGLSFTGRLISGIPTTAGTYHVPIQVHSGDRSTDATLTLRVDASPLLPPIVTSPLTKGIVLGSTYAYTIVASNVPTDIAVAGLPVGFTYDSSNRLISGFPDSAGSYPVEISATNGLGTTTAQVTFLAVPPEPEFFTAPATAFGSVGDAIFYPLSLAQDTTPSGSFIADWRALDLPASPIVYARNLPPGLYLDQADQQIRGEATRAGDYLAELLSADPFGNLTPTTVRFYIFDTVAAVPVPLKISSAPLCAAGAAGSPFSLDAWPDGRATDVTAKNLPPGLTLATGSGSSNGVPTKFAKISGQPSTPGVYPVELTFSNDTESATAIVTILVPESPLPPGLNGPLAAKGTVGRRFLFSFWENLSSSFHNAPTAYQVNDLPPGLSFDPTDYRFEGMPTQAGRYTVAISLSNAGGTTTAELTIVIDDLDAGRPRLVGSGGLEAATPGTGLTAAATGYIGQRFTFILLGDNAIDHLSVQGLPDALTLVRTGSDAWEIRGMPTETGAVHAFLTATNAHGSTTIPLTLNFRTLDQVTVPSLPTPTPTPQKTPRLALTSPKRVITTKSSVTLRGRVVFAQKNTRLTIQVAGQKARRVSLPQNGRFAVRVSSLHPGITIAELHLTSPSIKPRTVRVKIQRRSLR